MSLKVAGIQIKNVLGVEELEITPEGNIIEVSGRNGQGKTSIMEAIKDAVGQSNYSNLLRNGEEKGEVVLDLGDMLLKKTYKQNGETLKLEGRVAGTDSMTNISRPASVIKGLINPNSIDPVRLLTSKPKDLLDAVLGALPMKVDSSRMMNILNTVYQATDEHALVTIGKVVKAITEERKLVNRDAKTAKTTREQLEATLPENVETTEELQAKISDNLNKIDSIKQNARKVARETRFKFAQQISEKSIEISTIAGEIEDLLEKVQELKDAQAELSSELRVLETERDKESEAAMERELGKEDQYVQENVQLSEEISRIGIHENTQKQVREWIAKESEAVKTSNVYTEQLKNLQAYKEELCQDLPIKGLAITDGMLSMNGIPFQTLNTAARVDLVLELAKLSAGKLGLVILDNSECMDSETYKEFLNKASQTDLTFVVARVTDDELSIK